MPDQSPEQPNEPSIGQIVEELEAGGEGLLNVLDAAEFGDKG